MLLIAAVWRRFACMRFRWYTSLPLFVLLYAAPVSAQDPRPRPDTTRADTLRAPEDTVVRRRFLPPDSVPPDLPAADSLRPQLQGDTVLYLGLKRMPPLVPMRFEAGAPPFGIDETPFTDFVTDWRMGLEAELADQRVAYLRRVARAGGNVSAEAGAVAAADTAAAAAPDTVEYLPPLAPPDTTPRAGGLAGTVGEFADLGMVVSGRSELGGSWTRYSPCDPSLYRNCNPSLLPQMKPDIQFGVQAGGTISDRVHINVDYDQRREFDAANNINVYYQGREHEILQRVEVGDVSIRLPSSRFLTQGIPAGNFGFRALGQVGPIDFQTVFAQQKGDVGAREFRLAGGGGQQSGLVQDAQLVIDDADYVRGQFFFLLHPDSIAGAPAIDVLELQETSLPPQLRPARGGTLHLYRDERVSAQSAQQQAQLGYFLADAVAAEDTDVIRHSGLFRRLTQGEDYLVHASGGWILLRSPLRTDEALAVAYVTETGDTIGRVNAEEAPAGTTPELKLLRAPIADHQPDRPTWPYEMHNVYRMDSSSGVDLSSIDLRISLGELSGGRTFVTVDGRQITYLKLFGLDEDSPSDRIDQAQVYQPARDAGSDAGSKFPGTYIVFPTLEPFFRPPPVPSESLTAEQTQAALGLDANSTIYNTVDPVQRESGGRFRLTFDYRVTVDGLVSTFNLGAFGIREGSEKLYIGDLQLQPGIDYTIDYDIGQITLTDPRTVFGANPNAEIRATWEQKALFQVAPTSVFGMNARYDLGARGELNVVGLYQAEQTLLNRPQLGTEPGSIFLGGVSGRLELGGAWLDRALEALPLVSLGQPSSVRLEGELAMSAPNPNRHGDAYLDDFETTDEIPLDVRRQSWHLGSVPDGLSGDADVFPLSYDVATAAPLVWQHDYITGGGLVAGNVLPQRDIDQSIAITNTGLSEPAMWLTFGDESSPPDAPAWRSMTTVLSTTGRDFSRTEYLEFYVRARFDQPRALVFDIGTVGEDAFYFDSLGALNGTYPDARPWGLGVLDAEARLAQNEVWGRDKDALGLWDQPCTSEPLTPYPLGDPRANCTRGNGVNDSEDLDGSGVLSPDDGAFFRYVVRLDEFSPYLVKDTSATRTGYRLYRVPLREGSPFNGASEATWRFIEHLRMTVVGQPGSAPVDQRSISLARMKLVGSRWTKRDVYGIREGLLDDAPGVGETTTELRVGPVSRLTEGGAYASPPGVSDQLADPSQQFGVGAIEFNEKSLRLDYDGLLPGERAEVYYRYPQQPRNFLTYRQARLWAVAPEGDWGTGTGERLVVRVGTDPRNFYLFQTPLRAPSGTGNVTPADWVDLAIDFDQWLALRAQAEQLPPRAGGFTQDTLWSADSTYALVFEDRARAPNLAAVREITFAVYNAGLAPATGAVWLDELRLGAAVTDPGLAGNVRLDVTGDFLRGSVAYTSRGPVFRQLNEDARYYSSGDVSATMTANLERMMPAGWGIVAPLTVTHADAVQDPTFLSGTDVRTDDLPDLRTPDSRQTQVSFSIRKQTPAANPWIGLLLDGLQLGVRYNTLSSASSTTRNEATGFDGSLAWRHELTRRELDIMPGFLERALRALVPAAVERSQGFQRLTNLKLRYVPATLGFGAQYFDQEGSMWRYSSIFETPADAAIAPIRSPRRGLGTSAQLGLRPFESLSADFTLEMDRDLLDSELASTRGIEQQALEDARRRVAGLDVGWETGRALNSSIAWRPPVASWIAPSVTMSTRYSLDRDPSFIVVDTLTSSDSTGIMRQKFQNDRTINTALRIRPAALFRPDSAASPLRRVLGALGGRFETLDIAYNTGVASTYDRERFNPGLGYQLGWSAFDRLRFLSGDTAASARSRDEWRVGSTLRLPYDARLDFNFRDVESVGFDQFGGDRTQTERTWPGVRLSMNQIPMPLWLRHYVPSTTISAGYEKIERRSDYGSVVRATDENRIPVQVGLTLFGRLTASYNGSFGNGETVDPTGTAENSTASHVVQLSGSFMAPRSWRERLRRPIQTTLSYNDQTTEQCRYRQQEIDAGCVPYVDLLTRTLNLNFETTVSQITLGTLFSYTMRDNAVGLRNGTDQFQLGVYAGFRFNAGQLPLAPGTAGQTGIPGRR